MRTIECLPPKLLTIWVFNVDKLKDITEDTKKLKKSKLIERYLQLSLFKIIKIKGVRK
jgi:hypothetical protein